MGRDPVSVRTRRSSPGRRGPALLAKVEAELAADELMTPVLTLALDVRRKVALGPARVMP